MPDTSSVRRQLSVTPSSFASTKAAGFISAMPSVPPLSWFSLSRPCCLPGSLGCSALVKGLPCSPTLSSSSSCASCCRSGNESRKSQETRIARQRRLARRACASYRKSEGEPTRMENQDRATAMIIETRSKNLIPLDMHQCNLILSEQTLTKPRNGFDSGPSFVNPSLRNQGSSNRSRISPHLYWHSLGCLAIPSAPRLQPPECPTREACLWGNIPSSPIVIAKRPVGRACDSTIMREPRCRVMS